MLDLKPTLSGLRALFRGAVRMRVRSMLLVVMFVAVGFGAYRALAERAHREQLTSQRDYWAATREEYCALIRDAQANGHPDLIKRYTDQATRADREARRYDRILSGAALANRPLVPGDIPASEAP